MWEMLGDISYIKLVHNPRVNIVFTSLHTSQLYFYFVLLFFRPVTQMQIVVKIAVVSNT